MSDEHLSVTPAHWNAFIIIFSQERKLAQFSLCIIHYNRALMRLFFFFTHKGEKLNQQYDQHGCRQLSVSLANSNSYYWAEQKCVMCMSPLLIQWHPKEQSPRLFIILNTLSMTDFIKMLSHILYYITAWRANVLGLTVTFKYGNESHKLALCVYKNTRVSPEKPVWFKLPEILQFSCKAALYYSKNTQYIIF